MPSYITKPAEHGNVLFLILIAVALFAALSYAVTQSTRGGGEGASSETNLVNSAQITQYPATIKAAIIRLDARGIDYKDFEFNRPSDFSTCTYDKSCVFHSDGGGATYVDSSANTMADGLSGTWYFNLGFEIDGISTSTLSSLLGNEAIAFLPGVEPSLCQRLNEKIGITGDVGMGSDMSTLYTSDMNDSYVLPTTETILGSASTSTTGLTGQPFGCFQNDAANNGEYVYYHVLVEK